MASTELGQIQTFKAARDLSSYQYCPVYISAAGTVDYSGASGVVNGILQNKPANAGDAAEVLTASGVKAKLKVDGVTPGNIAVGNPLEADASYMGVAFTYNADGTTETYMIGWANEACTVASAYISVLTNFVPASK